MNIKSGSTAVSNVFLNEFLMNGKSSASEPASPSRARNWVFEYFSSVRFKSKDPADSENKDDSLKWVADNLKRLMNEYPDKWIVVKNRNVVEISDDLVDLLKRASRAGIVKPLVFKMDQLPKRKWRTVF
jgi:uncharacterized protein DUF5678